MKPLCVECRLDLGLCRNVPDPSSKHDSSMKLRDLLFISIRVVQHMPFANYDMPFANYNKPSVLLASLRGFFTNNNSSIINQLN